MAIIRKCLTVTALLLCMHNTKSQTIAYPAGSSQLLRSTAQDLSLLLSRSNTAFNFSSKEFNSIPNNGIILIYDSTVAGNGSCKVSCNGSDQLIFRASQDNGLVFGIYQYLQLLGYRFYLPGTIWENVPELRSAFVELDTTFSIRFKYQSWFISGGHNRWAMDNSDEYNWDTYFGENGHGWALYQRRNGMTGAYRFAGHRGDIMTAGYLSQLQNNPCFVASYDGSRIASSASVPDINNDEAMKLWSKTIGQQYTQFRDNVFGNKTLYANYYRNFNYNFGNLSIEVPDGAQWGNSVDNSGCSNKDYPNASDQHFILSNFTRQQLSATTDRFQVYAYSSHANVPSPEIGINKNIDVQVIPSAFQNETSAKGMMNRWYNSGASISEYHYLNIPQWGGETPMFNLNDLRSTLDRVKAKNSQGIVWEASPAKFASLPFLLASNIYLQNGTEIEKTLHQFCSLFGEASNIIFDLLGYWSNEKTVSTGEFIVDNKFKLPLYLKLLNDADQLTKRSSLIVKERVQELKAYMHYMVLYYDWIFDQRSSAEKASKGAQLCIYLARINRIKLVNSYFLITDICARYGVSSDFYRQYNSTNGSAYLNGNLSLISADEIENNFEKDLVNNDLIDQYSFESANTIIDNFLSQKLEPAKSISVKISYTNGAEYPNRSEFYIYAPIAGKFVINYTPHFNTAGKGYINFTVESVDGPLNIIKDLSIDQKQSAGSFVVNLPGSGRYKLSVVSKYRSSVDLEIKNYGNYFYKNGPFLGNKTENYRDDLASLPGYFYVPSGMNKIYFSINNSNPGGKGFATPQQISNAFIFSDNNGNKIIPRLVNPADSSLFFMDIPAGSGNSFWQVYKMEQYDLCFANISNMQWYAKRKEKAIEIEAIQTSSAPVIYPNPSSGIFNISNDHSFSAVEEIRIFDMTGKMVGSFGNVKQFDLSDLPSGAYFYKIIKNGNIYTGKLLKQ
jgi:hypothetical protein